MTRVPTLLQVLRLAHGLSVEDLAERADVNPDHLRRVERGAASPSRWLADRLASALETKREVLFETAIGSATDDVGADQAPHRGAGAA